MDIRESIILIMSVSKHQKLINEFARSKYDEKFPSSKRDYIQGWNSYDGFIIISESKIKINYNYGAGDMEFSDSFIVDLTPEIRDNKINEILK